MKPQAQYHTTNFQPSSHVELWFISIEDSSSMQSVIKLGKKMKQTHKKKKKKKKKKK